MQLRMGTTGALILWTPVCFTAFAVAQYALKLTTSYILMLMVFNRTVFLYHLVH